MYNVHWAILAIAVSLLASSFPLQAQQQQRPQLPVSYGHAQNLNIPAERLNEQLGTGLPPVSPEGGPPPPAPAFAPLSAPLDAPTSVFSPENAPVGAWSNLRNPPPGGPYNFGNPLVLTDGSVIIHRT